MRTFKAGWPEVVWSGLLAAAVSVVYIWFFVPELSPANLGQYPGVIGDQIRAVLLMLVICSAGIFLLPLFDPRVRQGGPAPTLWKVALVALGLVLLIALIDRAVTPLGDFGLILLIVGGVAAVLLAGAGLILSLFRAYSAGAWLGGLGIILWFFVLLAWTLAGRPWFP